MAEVLEALVAEILNNGQEDVLYEVQKEVKAGVREAVVNT